MDQGITTVHHQLFSYKNPFLLSLFQQLRKNYKLVISYIKLLKTDSEVSLHEIDPLKTTLIYQHVWHLEYPGTQQEPPTFKTQNFVFQISVQKAQGTASKCPNKADLLLLPISINAHCATADV